jgi:hypothetical protein
MTLSRAELPWRLAVMALRNPVRTDWVIGRLHEHPDWEALVPTGADKMALRGEVEELLRAIVRA